MTNMATITLRRGNALAEVRPLAGRIGEVVGGNCRSRGELVICPPDLGWEVAGETLLSPFELESIYSETTDWKYRPQSAEDTFSTARDPTDVDVVLAREIHKIFSQSEEIWDTEASEAA